MRAKFKRSYTDPRELEEAIQSAKDLGFEPTKFAFHGAWEAEGEPFYGNKADDFVKAGSKYFHFRMDVDNFSREVWRCEPVQTGRMDDGKLIVTFEEA